MAARTMTTTLETARPGRSGSQTNEVLREQNFVMQEMRETLDRLEGMAYNQADYLKRKEKEARKLERDAHRLRSLVKREIGFWSSVATLCCCFRDLCCKGGVVGRAPVALSMAAVAVGSAAVSAYLTREYVPGDCDDDPAVPINDKCETAANTTLGLFDSEIVSGSTVFGTADSGTAPPCFVEQEWSPGLWYHVNFEPGPIYSGLVFDTCFAGTDFATQLSVYTGECGNLSCNVPWTLTLVEDSINCGNQGRLEYYIPSELENLPSLYVLVNGEQEQVGDFVLKLDR